MAKIIRKPNPTKPALESVQNKQNPKTAKTQPLKAIDSSPIKGKPNRPLNPPPVYNDPRFLPERNHKKGCLVFVFVLVFIALVVTAFFLF